MFNKILLSVLAKILGVLTIAGAVVFFVSGFFVAGQETAGTVAEKAGYIVGYEIGGLGMFALAYVILGALYHSVNRK